MRGLARTNRLRNTTVDIDYMIITNIKNPGTNLQDDQKDLSMVLIWTSAVLFLFINPMYGLMFLGFLNIISPLEPTGLKKGLFRRLLCTLGLWAFVINRQYGVSWGIAVIGIDDIPNYLDIFEKLITKQISFPFSEPILYLGALFFHTIGVQLFVYLMLISLFGIFSIVHLLFSVQTRPYTALAFLVSAILPIWDIWGHLSRTSLALGFFCFLLIDNIANKKPNKAIGTLSVLTHLSFILVTPFYYLVKAFTVRHRWLISLIVFLPGIGLFLVTNYLPLTSNLFDYVKVFSYQYTVSNINIIFYALATYFLIFNRSPVILITSALYLSTLFISLLGYGVITERYTLLLYTIFVIVLISTVKSKLNISALYIGSLIIYTKNYMILSDKNSISLIFQYFSRGEPYSVAKGILINILEMRWAIN